MRMVCVPLIMRLRTTRMELLDGTDSVWNFALVASVHVRHVLIKEMRQAHSFAYDFHRCVTKAYRTTEGN